MRVPLATALLAVSISLAMSGSAEAKAVSYRNLYNTATNLYNSLQNISGSHDAYLARHHARCRAMRRAESRSWWVVRDRQDANVIKALQKRLSQSTPKQKRSRTYRDFVKTGRDLKGWNGGRIAPRLVTCRQTPQQSSSIAQDLSNLSNDLGIGIY